MDVEKMIKDYTKRNKKFLNEFEVWLIEKQLTNKTICKHCSNAQLFINDYLIYYEGQTMEEGIISVYNFLAFWFIEKCMWSSRTSVKETASSIKKFYLCMTEKGYIKEEDYNYVCRTIKDNMDEFLENVDASYDWDDYL